MSANTRSPILGTQQKTLNPKLTQSILKKGVLQRQSHRYESQRQPEVKECNTQQISIRVPDTHHIMCDETSLANVTERTMGCDLEPNLVLNESIPQFHKDSSYTFLDEV